MMSVRTIPKRSKRYVHIQTTRFHSKKMRNYQLRIPLLGTQIQMVHRYKYNSSRLCGYAGHLTKPAHGDSILKLHQQFKIYPLTEGAHGIGAKSATVAQVAIQVPRATLQAMMAGGAAGRATPITQPAPA